MNQTSFAHQKNILNSFLNNLNELTESLTVLSENHEKLLETLHEDQGLMDEIHSEYKEGFLVIIKNDISELIRKINEENIPFIEKEVDFISSH